MKTKHGVILGHDKEGYICCEGCYKIGLKDGKEEIKKEFIKIIKDLDARYGMNDVCENRYGLNKPSIIFHIKDWEALIKQLEEKK